jgi:hypothetical protein
MNESKELRPGFVQLTLRIGSAQVSEEHQEISLQQLQRELLELDVEAVDQVQKKQFPVGSKGIAVDLSVLLLKMAASGGVLTALIKVIQAWLSRDHRATTITLEIGGDKLSIKNADSKEQRKLIASWLKRHRF